MVKASNNKQPKTVTRATYFQSLAIAVLLAGGIAWVTSYFTTISIYADARQNVVADLEVVSKAKK